MDNGVGVTREKAERVLDDVERFGLHGFVRHFWQVIDPAPFIDNWHIGAICEVAQAVSRRQIKHVVISVPPGTGKTKLIGDLWLPWHWGPFGDPRHAWMFASFDQVNMNRSSRNNQSVLTSDLFRACWPQFRMGGGLKQVTYFQNAYGGSRLSTTPRGKATGFHAHTQVCDDPIKPSEADSPGIMRRIWDWWSGTMSSRIAGRHEDFRRVIVMQRLAEGDLSGCVLREYGYEHLMLPMSWVPGATWDCGITLGKLDCRDPESGCRDDSIQQGPGALLDPVRFRQAVVAERKKEMDPGDYSAQYQQNPVPEEGGIIDPRWVRFEWNPSEIPIIRRLIQSWDFGFKGADKATRKQSRSRVAGHLWGAAESRYYLLDRIEPEHLNYPQARDAFLAAQARRISLPRQTIVWGQATPKLIEDKANGPAIIAELRAGIPIPPEEAARYRAIPQTVVRSRNGLTYVQVLGLPEDMPCPRDDKAVRLKAHSGKFRGGLVLLPPEGLCGTVRDYRHELTSFPVGIYDDEVDTTTQALDALATPDTPLWDEILRT